MQNNKPVRRRIRDLSIEEERAETVRLQAETEEANREAAPLFAAMRHEEEDDAGRPLPN